MHGRSFQQIADAEPDRPHSPGADDVRFCFLGTVPAPVLAPIDHDAMPARKGRTVVLADAQARVDDRMMATASGTLY